MKKLRESVSSEIKSQYDEAIYKKLINSTYYDNAKVIFVYVSFGYEVDTHRIINHALKDNKIVCVPKVLNRTEGMKAVKINSLEELKVSNFGVLEPESTINEVEPLDIDLLLIPGLAFDENGGRLGYGAGYYDKFLGEIRTNANKIGLSYSFQLMEAVPIEEHDMPIEHIITN